MGMQCDFCPKFSGLWLYHEGYIYCEECFILLVIRFEHTPCPYSEAS